MGIKICYYTVLHIRLRLPKFPLKTEVEMINDKLSVRGVILRKRNSPNFKMEWFQGIWVPRVFSLYNTNWTTFALPNVPNHSKNQLMIMNRFFKKCIGTCIMGKFGNMNRFTVLESQNCLSTISLRLCEVAFQMSKFFTSLKLRKRKQK